MATTTTAATFQSAPGFSAGRYQDSQSGEAARLGFNPLPAFRPGDTDDSARAAVHFRRVSIRSRLFGREIRNATAIIEGTRNVSIRSRLFGREIPASCAGRSRGSSGFNPLPAFRPGDTPDKVPSPRLSIGFNPLPAFRPGDTPDKVPSPRLSMGFNPLPAFRPGDTRRLRRSRGACNGFNPLPAFRPGDTWRPRHRSGIRSCFNPLPAFRPGDTFSALVHGLEVRVSIRSRLFGREIHGEVEVLLFQLRVSIRSRLFGREIRPIQQAGDRG